MSSDIETVIIMSGGAMGARRGMAPPRPGDVLVPDRRGEGKNLSRHDSWRDPSPKSQVSAISLYASPIQSWQCKVEEEEEEEEVNFVISCVTVSDRPYMIEKIDQAWLETFGDSCFHPIISVLKVWPASHRRCPPCC